VDGEGARHREAALVADLQRAAADEVRVGPVVEREDDLLEQRRRAGRRVGRLRIHVGGIGELDREELAVRIVRAARRAAAAATGETTECEQGEELSVLPRMRIRCGCGRDAMRWHRWGSSK